MKNTPTSPASPAEKLSKTNVLWTRTIKRFMSWLNRHEIDLLILSTLIGGAILFVLAMRQIASG